MLNHSDIQRLRRKSSGTIIEPDDAEYDNARAVYNAMIDRRPRLIARCGSVDDVIHAVDFAAEHALPLAVRGGGHNGAGLGSCDDGIVIDLRDLREVQVDPVSREVTVDGGCTWAEVDRATHAHGLATPSGIVSSTGVGGSTLGGGIGHLSRKFGLSVDNLIAADVVLADGNRVRASADSHPDLFWAIRGGGGNFGIVTRFVFRLHPVETVFAGPVLWPIERATEVLEWYRDFIAHAPEDLNGIFAFLNVPPAPPFPAALHGRSVCGIVWCYSGDEDAARDALVPMDAIGEPLFDGLGPMPFPALQNSYDALYPPGLQWFWHSDFFRTLPEEAIEALLNYGGNLPTPLSTIHLYPVNGAVHRVEADATAFGNRDVTWSCVVVGVDPDPASARTIRDWADECGAALHPFSAGGSYVNFMMDEGELRIRATYHDNYARLAEIKRRYDPENLFHINHNIRPATD